MKLVQEQTKTRFRLGACERYDWDQEKESLVFSDQGIAKVVAKIQFVGSISTVTNTWLWAWANESVLPGLCERIWQVKAFGEENGYWQLHTSKWEADEIDGWTMTAIAANLLQAKGAYRSPKDNGFTFMIYTQIDWADNVQRN
ncbi:MAG: hypothetical protein DCC68_08965 [Planctomycetota bacterium]|nr:MAG: hypothetical protein DCC68_08965 [Planctomycetota bacterium]